MKIFRDPTLALTTALVLGLTGVSGAALLAGDDTDAVQVDTDAAAAVRHWRSHLGQLLRLSATRDAGLHRLGDRLEALARTEADRHGDSPLGRAWTDAAVNAQQLGAADLTDADEVTTAVAGVVSSADVLAAVAFDGLERTVVVGGALEPTDPGLRRDTPALPSDTDPAFPQRPVVPTKPPATPRLAPDAPSAPLPRSVVPVVPAPAPSTSDTFEESPR